MLTDTGCHELSGTDFGVQLASIDWNLANLKILQGSTFANASYQKGALMQVRPSGADGMVGITGDEMAAHKTVTHEVEHLLQNMAEQMRPSSYKNLSEFAEVYFSAVMKIENKVRFGHIPMYCEYCGQAIKDEDLEEML